MGASQGNLFHELNLLWKLVITLETLCGGQFTRKTQLIKPNDLALRFYLFNIIDTYIISHDLFNVEWTHLVVTVIQAWLRSLRSRFVCLRP